MKFLSKLILFGYLQCAFLGLAQAMQDEKKDIFYAIILPGQNGLGGNSFEGNNIVNCKGKKYETLHTWKIDFGQGNCINDFEAQLKKDNEAANKKKLLFGVSQGTATLINWLAKKSKTEQEKEVGALVLESVLGSGNSAIRHTVESAMPIVSYLPFSHTWLPWGAKLFFPTYNPLGEQAFSSAKKLSPNIPVIIMHNKGDFQLSINDARELYCILKKNGNKNVYLIEVNNGQRHLDILNYQDEKIGALQAIYQKHNLPYSEDKLLDYNGDLSKFQPSIEEVRKRISVTNWKIWLRATIDVCGCVAGYLCYKWYKNRSHAGIPILT